MPYDRVINGNSIARLFSVCRLGRGTTTREGGTQQSSMREGSYPRSKTLPFLYTILKEWHPFRIPFAEKGSPFT